MVWVDIGTWWWKIKTTFKLTFPDYNPNPPSPTHFWFDWIENPSHIGLEAFQIISNQTLVILSAEKNTRLMMVTHFLWFCVMPLILLTAMDKEWMSLVSLMFLKGIWVNKEAHNLTHEEIKHVFQNSQSNFPGCTYMYINGPMYVKTSVIVVR